MVFPQTCHIATHDSCTGAAHVKVWSRLVNSGRSPFRDCCDRLQGCVAARGHVRPRRLPLKVVMRCLFSAKVEPVACALISLHHFNRTDTYHDYHRCEVRRVSQPGPSAEFPSHTAQPKRRACSSLFHTNDPSITKWWTTSTGLLD